MPHPFAFVAKGATLFRSSNTAQLACLRRGESGGTGINWAPGYNQANNRYALSGTSYDANGNLLNDTFHTYTWNQDNHPVSIDSSGCGTNGWCFTYDAMGRVVEKNGTTTHIQILYSPVGKTAIMSGQTTTQSYVPLPGGATEFESSGGTHHFWHKDWLGSVRLSTGVTNRNMIIDRAFAPFGEVYKDLGATNEISFTGDTQDMIAKTFDTPNREQNPTQGRWISPDPAHAGWNAYSYVGGNPLLLTDRAGLGPDSPYPQLLIGPPHTERPHSPFGSPAGDGGVTCILDGVETDCGMVEGAVASGAGVPCPNNVCAGFSNGQYFQFMAGAGGGQGYVPSSIGQEGLYEANGSFMSAAEYQVYIAKGVEAQREALADAISLASDSPDGSNWNDIYDHLIPTQIAGGHEDFSWTGDPNMLDFVPQSAWDTGGCLLLCRYGFIDQIHFNDNMFHLDTVGANWGFGLGLLLHGIFDFGFGNINPGVPMVP